MKKVLLCSALMAMLCVWFSCNPSGTSGDSRGDSIAVLQKKVDQYALVKLTTDVSQLSDKQQQMLPPLIKAAQVMDTLYWYQTYGHRDSLLNSLSDSMALRYVKINYGPWDRLNNDSPFIAGVGPKPAGANFYPVDMTKAAFQKADIQNKAGLYDFIRRDSAGKLYSIPYHEWFKAPLSRAAAYLKQAAALAEMPGLAKYLNLRAEALLTDDYHNSDVAWLDMKNNTIGLVIGPIETYEDRLFGYKASYECYVLVKDKVWSKKLEKFTAYLPQLQKDLPVDAAYKTEKPGSEADLNVYDVVYYAGAANAGGKTIAINLPNDEQIQLEKGTRRLQLKNAMRAKFDKILVPIADVLITPEQRKYIDFDAFFANTMFHEVAHGLGIKHTIDKKGTVRKALKEHAAALEEGKADILGLFMVEQLLDKGAIEGDLKAYYTTFIASIFRSVRFGAGDAHGVANMIRFNYFKEHQAFERLENGSYRVNFQKMQGAIDSLSNLILTLQGNGDYKGVAKLVQEKGKIGPQLQKDLDRLNAADIPVDIVFDQGVKILGLK